MAKFDYEAHFGRPAVLKDDGTFCAPWCGHGCTKAKHDQAHKNAAKLAKRMGDGWTLCVWENMGWHYSVTSPCRRIKVHPPHRRGDTFIAFLGEPGVGGRWSAQNKDPKKAISAVVAEAKNELTRIDAVLNGL